MKKPVYYSGLSALQLPVPKYRFPAPHQHSSRLTYYATFFNSIEFNSTFYRVPLPATVGKWATSVRSGFKFTFKLWKEITHVKNLDYKPADVERFLNAVSKAGHHMGCLLIQFPPSLESDVYKLEKLLDIIRNGRDGKILRIGVEFRNKSWYHNKVYEMIKSYNAAVVIHDMPGSATPLIDYSPDFMYVRFHGPTGNYNGTYGEDFLSEYATYIHEWMQEGKDVYLYFNNTIGDAFGNAVLLKKLVDQTYSAQAY
jgi:uncharacterized protein YecE (DUF72 family)